MSKSAKIALIWVIISLAMAVIIGLFAIPIYDNPILSTQDSEKVFIKMAMDFFNPWIGGLILASILAAIMSTIDSQLLASSTTLAQDFYAFVVRKNASEKELLLVNRFLVTGITLVACILALNPNETIFSLVTFAWGGFGAAFGPAIILSLYYRKFNYKGAVAGIITGFAVSVLWLIFLSGVTGLYEIIPGFIISLIVAIVVSKCTKGPEADVVELFDEVSKLDSTFEG